LHDSGLGDDVLVLALPRGGVPVAYEIAEALDAPLDVFVVRKLGLPGHEELAIGALASGGMRVVDVTGRTVVLVDDGVATGATARAAVSALRVRRPARIVVAVPTASQSALTALRALADDVVCLVAPEPFVAVALSYLDFSEISEGKVSDFLSRA
jgi:predicted phosphoribosyltransferase